MTWTSLTPQEKQTTVRQLIEGRGQSYQQCAIALGTSRVAIAGVVSRARDKGTPILTAYNDKVAAARLKRAAARPKPRPERKAPTPKRPKSTYNPPVVTDRDALTAPDATPVRASAWLPLPGSTPVPISALPTGACRWACYADDQPMLFCGLPVDAAGVYCDVHHRMGVRLDPLKPIRFKKEDTHA